MKMVLKTFKNKIRLKILHLIKSKRVNLFIKKSQQIIFHNLFWKNKFKKKTYEKVS